jgi:hypothetical protein
MLGLFLGEDMLKTEHEDAANDTMPIPTPFIKSRRVYLIILFFQSL